MIQSYAQIKKQVHDINEQAQGQIYIQKIYSSSQFVSLSLRFSGFTRYIFLGRGSGFEGIWLGEKQIPSFIRKKDVFLEYLRKYLSATILLEVEADNKDRIFAIRYQKWGVVNSMALFYRGRKLYFAHHYYDSKSQMMRIFKSWSQEKELSEDFSFDIFDEVGRQKQDAYEDKQFISIDTLLESESKKAFKTSSETKKLKFLKRKISNIESDLTKVRKKDQLKIYIDETHNLDSLDKTVYISGLKFKFKETSHFKRRDEIYNKIKSFNKAEGILSSRLEETKKELLGHKSNNLLKSELAIIKPVWRTVKSNSFEKTKTGSIEIFKFKDYEVGIGINAQGNDYLRGQWASKSDYWFHLEGDVSPHIVIKLKLGVLSDEIFRIVASAMVRFSNNKSSEVQMIYTLVKNLKGVKGAAGRVLYKKEKHIKIHNIPDWDTYIALQS